eukprot:Rmarinus@m.4982
MVVTWQQPWTLIESNGEYVLQLTAKVTNMKVEGDSFTFKTEKDIILAHRNNYNGISLVLKGATGDLTHDQDVFKGVAHLTKKGPALEEEEEINLNSRAELMQYEEAKKEFRCNILSYLSQPFPKFTPPRRPQSLCVFLSSEGGDSEIERQALARVVFPKVRKYASERGVTFDIVDLSLGLDSPPCDPKGDVRVNTASEMIRHCHMHSDGLFFLSFWGQKYGSRSLPTSLNASDADEILSKLSEEDKHSFESVYRRDANVLDGVRYVPNARFEKECTVQEAMNTKARLREVLVPIAEQVWGEDKARYVFCVSSLQRESEVAISLVEKGTRLQAAWLRRHFDKEISPDDEAAPRYADMNGSQMDMERRVMWEIYAGEGGSIEGAAQDLGPAVALMPFHTTFVPGKGVTETSSHVSRMCAAVENLLTKEVDSIKRRASAWEAAVSRLDLSARVLEDTWRQIDWMQAAVREFHGRGELMQDVLDHVLDPRAPGKSATLAIAGPTGCGKSYLMAKLSKLLAEKDPDGTVLFRSVGLTTGCPPIHEILISLLQQWNAIKISKGESGMGSIPEDLSPQDIFQRFEEMLVEAEKNKNRLYVLIDGVERIQEVEGSRSKLSWLPSRCGSHVRIVVSTRIEDSESGTPEYGCLGRLSSLGIPVIQIFALEDAEIKTITRQILSSNGRHITDIQERMFLHTLKDCDSAPLLILSIRHAMRWLSGQRPDDTPPTIADAIQIELELMQNECLFVSNSPIWKNHLSRRIFGYLCLSHAPLSIFELGDLLSLDDDVAMTCIEGIQLSNGFVRFPLLYLCTMLLALRPIVCIGDDGYIRFGHALYERVLRQLFLGESCEEDQTGPNERSNVLSPSERIVIHRNLLEYFRGDWHAKLKPLPASQSPIGSKDMDRLVPAQDVWYGDILHSAKFIPNVARLTHTVPLMLRCGQVEEAARELCNLNYLEAACKAGMLSEAAASLAMVSFALSPRLDSPAHNTDLRKRVTDYLRFLSKSSPLLSAEHSMIMGTAHAEPDSSFVHKDAAQIVSSGNWTRPLPVYMGMERLAKRFPHAIYSDNEAEFYLPLRTPPAVVSSNGDVVAYAVINDISIRQENSTTMLKGHTSEVVCMALTTDHSLLASGSHDKSIGLWNVAEKSLKRTLTGHTGGVTCLDFRPDNDLLVSGSEDKTVRLWNATSGVCLRTLKGHVSAVTLVFFNPMGNLFVSLSEKEDVCRVWNVVPGDCIAVVDGVSLQRGVKSILFGNNRAAMFTDSRWRSMRLWGDSGPPAMKSLEKHSDWVNTVAFSPDGKILASGSDDKSIRLWDVWSGDYVATLESGTAHILHVAFSGNGEIVACGCHDKRLRVYTCQGEVVHALSGHGDWVTGVSFGIDDNVLVSSSKDKTLRVWDRTKGDCLRVLKGHTAAVSSVDCSPVSSHCVSGSSDGTLRLWNHNTGKCLRVFSGHTQAVTAACFSPVGNELLSSSIDRTMRLWSAETGDCTRVFHGHNGGISACCFGTDTFTLISGSVDKTIRLWDRTSGEFISIETKSWVTSLAANQEGTLIALGAKDKTVKVLHLQPANEHRTAQS